MELMLGLAAKAGTTAAVNAGLGSVVSSGSLLAGSAVAKTATGLAAKAITDMGVASAIGGAAATTERVLNAAKTAGTILQSGGMAIDAVNAKRGADFEAKQMETQAGQERASAQRRAREDRREKRLIQSRAQALSAASGGGAVDPSVVDIIGDLEEDGEYRALNSIWEGEDRARGLTTGAKQRRKQGRFALTSGLMGSAGTILDGSSSMYKRFGR